MDFSREANNKNCSMNSLPMLVSLIETAIKEKTIDKMYGDFLEEAIKMGLSSYTLNVLVINAKNRIENEDIDNSDDLIIPFVYRQDIIKPEPEIKKIIQEKVVYKKAKGFVTLIVSSILLLISAFLIIFINYGEIGKLEQMIDNQSKRIINLTDSLRLNNNLISNLHQELNKLHRELNNVTRFTYSTGASIRNNDSSDRDWIMWVKSNAKVKITSFYVKGGNSSNGEVVLAIYDSNDNLIATKTTDISGFEFRKVTLDDSWQLGTGYYYIRIKESNGKSLQYHSSNDKEYAQFTGGALEVTGCSSYSGRGNVDSRNKHGYYQYFYNIQYEIIPNDLELDQLEISFKKNQ